MADGDFTREMLYSNHNNNNNSTSDNTRSDNTDNTITSSTNVAVITRNDASFIGQIIDIDKYGDYLKLLRVTGYVLRYVRNLKRKISNESLVVNRYITTEEINDARTLWILDNQSGLFDDKRKYSEMRVSLNLKIEENGVVRSYGRLKNARIPFDTKTPILINREHKLAEMLVRYMHERVLHRGVKQTLTELRGMYWIVRGRSFVKRLLKPCVVCRKLNTRPYEYPVHSDLPDVRFDDLHPFSSTGADLMGPLLCLPVYGGKEERLYKAYIKLIVPRMTGIQKKILSATTLLFTTTSDHATCGK